MNHVFIKFIKRHYEVLILCIIMLAVVIIYSKSETNEFNKSFEGMVYRLHENTVCEISRVDFNGYIKKHIFNDDEFRGKIVINNEEYENCIMNLKPYSRGDIIHVKKSGYIEFIGHIYFDEKYNSFTIALYEKTGVNKNNVNSENMLMFTTPAISRIEAIKLARYHMPGYDIN